MAFAFQELNPILANVLLYYDGSPRTCTLVTSHCLELGSKSDIESGSAVHKLCQVDVDATIILAINQAYEPERAISVDKDNAKSRRNLKG
jgi:hypothetical protein